MDQESYTLRTRVNRLLAIERLIGFIEENVACGTRRFAIKPEGNWRRKMQELKAWVTSQLGYMRRFADEETKMRNSRIVYEKEGRWADFSLILAVTNPPLLVISHLVNLLFLLFPLLGRNQSDNPPEANCCYNTRSKSK
jgi:hypothetical protein